MQYMRLSEDSRQELLEELAGMTHQLRDFVQELPDVLVRKRGADGAFSPVEQVWHLADLEAEAFASRIRRLLEEPSPKLPDFDGTAIAQERRYLERSVEEGLARFETARRENLAQLRAIPESAWNRSGVQVGVGPVSLCDMPVFLHQHDLAHLEEIAVWRREVLGSGGGLGHRQ